MRARAIEKCIHVIVSNSVGNVNNKNHVDNIYAGHSMVINPNGHILEEGRDQDEIMTAEIYIQKVIE
ncbi:hypothetical protein BK737_13750 [Bacillus thuringiensis serovar palmanyolensis]|nr:hypothetical protein BK737_13750 [Bacillus thuringiensis serovar palmanyolensis]